MIVCLDITKFIVRKLCTGIAIFVEIRNNSFSRLPKAGSCDMNLDTIYYFSTFCKKY
jgi:hypothetical protein